MYDQWMKGLLYLILLLNFSGLAHSRVSFSANMGTGFLSSKQLDDQKAQAMGNRAVFKVGSFTKNFEIGVYNSIGSFKADINHDDSDHEINYKTTSFGVYTTLYKKSLFLELSYGKSTIKEELKTDLSDSSKAIIKEIYNINDDKITGSEAGVLLGYKLFIFGDTAGTISIERKIQLQTSHVETQISFELKHLL
jgi:hypothetical protein